MQAPACWDTSDDVVPTRFETDLLAPEDQPGALYLEMSVRSVRLEDRVHMILPLADARRLRDQLSTHLDAAESGAVAAASVTASTARHLSVRVRGGGHGGHSAAASRADSEPDAAMTCQPGGFR